MKTFQNIFVKTVSYFFILLFIYASVSKLLDFENFQVQIAQSPLLSAYAGFISYAVIISELIISLALILYGYRLVGLYASLFLMTSFTLYIYLILNYSEYIPCSCGGVLEKLDWESHLIFNILCILIAVISIFLMSSIKIKPVRTLVLLFSTVLSSSSVVLILFFSSEHLIKKNNQFIRRFSHHPIQIDKSLDLKVNSYYFAGESNGKIILGNYTNPMVLTVVDSSFSQYRQKILKLDQYNHQFKFLKLYARDSYFFLADGSVPVMYRGLITEGIAKTISYNKIYFDQLAILDSTNVAFRTYNPKTQNRSTGIVNLLTGLYHLNPDIIKKQKDGLFDTDGLLTSDNESKQFYYIYFYRNTITSVDLNEKISQQNTIDTTTIAKVKSTVMSNGKMKMTAPPVMVNKMATVAEGLLFNESNLMGNYENRDQWGKNSIIDIYNTKDKSYRGSFYVQHKGKNKMIQMFATRNYFYILIGNEIIRYRYAQAISENFSKGDAENLKSE
ncbi:DoxX family protein [Epilithonimonas sp.]|uniref:DoxX family protein n=1 Tax=Epilithonimonas sp. TaxID=2894511 RepID=UPI0028A5C155|nr:DoxX family protein [Epilithonimonas sp.]